MRPQSTAPYMIARWQACRELCGTPWNTRRANSPGAHECCRLPSWLRLRGGSDWDAVAIPEGEGQGRRALQEPLGYVGQGEPVGGGKQRGDWEAGGRGGERGMGEGITPCSIRTSCDALTRPSLELPKLTWCRCRYQCGRQ